ncbi:hypothetical protein V7O66_13755 [Methanolobus sp. ZRKC3]
MSPRQTEDDIPIMIFSSIESHSDSYINEIAKHDRDCINKLP